MTSAPSLSDGNWMGANRSQSRCTARFAASACFAILNPLRESKIMSTRLFTNEGKNTPVKKVRGCAHHYGETTSNPW